MGHGSDRLSLSASAHIKALYLLIALLIAGEIGAYYHSLYLFRSVRDDCAAVVCSTASASSGGDCEAEGILQGRHGRVADDDDNSDDDTSRTVPTVDDKLVKTTNNLAESQEATRDNINNNVDDDVIASARDRRSVDGEWTLSFSKPNEADARDRNRHVRRQRRHRRHKTADDGGGKGQDKVRRHGDGVTSDEPAVEFIPRHDKSRQDGSLQSPDYVWLTSYSRIPLPAMQEFCRATKEYCPEGPAGPPGVPGIPGDKGHKGDSGDLGYPGDAGMQGYPGMPGPRGPKGEPGSSGRAGLDGLDGIGGANGLDGVPGRAGTDGRDGKDGIPGINGRPGTNGTDGIPGFSGPPGPRGPEGREGFPGPRGKKGIDGKPGTAGLPGVSAWMINGTKQEILLVPPVIIDKEMHKLVVVREGENIRVPCAATGQPRPDVVWRREDSHTIITGSWKTSSIAGKNLEFPAINREHMGDYLCIASNGVPPMDMKTAKVEVLFAPYIKVRSQRIGTKNGSYALLACDIEAFPESISDWLMEDDTPIENSTKHVIRKVVISYRVHLTLNVTDMKRRDYGQYKCVGRNEFGTTKGVVTVYEIDPRLHRPTDEEIGAAFGKASPQHVSMDDLCPAPDPCPTCAPPPKRFCPDIDGIYDIYVVNFGFGGNKTWKELTPRTSNCILHQIGKPVYHRYTNSVYGTWLNDPSPHSPSAAQKYWVTRHNDSRSLYEYADKSAYRIDNVTKVYQLPFPFVGNSHVIYNSSFYYHMSNTTVMVRFDLNTKAHYEKHVPDVSFTDDRFLYTTQYSYIDFSIDENGMWAIYGLTDCNNTLVMKFDPVTLEPSFMWNLTLDHRTVGDLFIVCGVMYAVDSIDKWNANIRFAFDLYQNKMIEPGAKIPFTNPYRMNTVIGYNPRDKVLFSWDGGHQLYYPIKFATLFIPTVAPDETTTAT